MLIPLVLAALPVLSSSRAVPVPLGEEAFGNEAVGNNQDWVGGIQGLANAGERVYRVWVNGNESFYYRGDTAAVNRALAAFAAVEGDDPRLVHLMPSKGWTESFEGIAVPHDWSLNVRSGIAWGMREHRSLPVVDDHRHALWIHVGGRVAAEDLVFPEGLTLRGPDDLLERCRQVATGDEGNLANALYHAAHDVGFLPEALELLVDGIDEARLRPYLAGWFALVARGRPSLRQDLLDLGAGREGEARARVERALAAYAPAETGTEAPTIDPIALARARTDAAARLELVRAIVARYAAK